jgi:predicted HTH transcriptional regulator
MESVKELIAQGEHQQLDFKFAISDARKIARTLCAFANTDGGSLLIGVKDNGKIAGVDPSEEIHMIEAAADMYCSPKLTFTTKVWKEDMKLVLEVHIDPSPVRPVMARDDEGRWRAYVRRKDHTLLANKILLNVWKLSKFQKAPEKIGDEETTLLRIIDKYEPLTLSQIYKASKLSKGKIDQLLSLFIVWDLVEMYMDESETTYRLSSSSED